MAPIVLLALGLGIGGYVYYNKTHQQKIDNAKQSIPPLPPQGLTFDPGMSVDTQNVVNNVLLNENDSVNLRNLAIIMRQKGYNNAAAALEAKAAATTLTNGAPVIPPPTPAIINIAPPIQPINLANLILPGGISIAPDGTISFGSNTPTITIDESPLSTLQIQHALNILGILGQNGQPLAEDGIMGPNTTFAINTLQQQAGMTPTGQVTPHLNGVIRVALQSIGQSV